MKDLYLVNYSVKGIKAIDELVSLSFYKKVITKEMDTKEYNIKGVYGTNGSGKSGIITSIDILKNILVNPGYLNNPIVQKNLEEIINKKLGELYICADFVGGPQKALLYFRYEVKLSKDSSGKYVIVYEHLSVKKATSKQDTMESVFVIENGEIKYSTSEKNDKVNILIKEKTTNLLDAASLSVLFFEKIFPIIRDDNEIKGTPLLVGVSMLFLLGTQLYVYFDQSDDHREYILSKAIEYNSENDMKEASLIEHFVKLDRDCFDILLNEKNLVAKELYYRFEKKVNKLCEFLRIFKPELKKIEIDRKENKDIYTCYLVMVYDSYKIYAEYESTGIKKLIKLYAYLQKMMQGGIVFIDEFDSNLHDVYLCALLEYLMEYGKGQLCFTTHNVGPMDVLKRNKKSIDFLSADKKIYPWTTNGNYSPSKLYRNGMIEGSPFNIDSIDFIGVFDKGEEDDV